MPTVLFNGQNLGGFRHLKGRTRPQIALARLRRDAGTRRAADALLAMRPAVAAGNEIGCAAGPRDGYDRFYGGDRCGLWVRDGIKVVDDGRKRLSDAFSTAGAPIGPGRNWGHPRDGEFVVVDVGLANLVEDWAVHAPPMRGHEPAEKANAEFQRNLAGAIRRAHAAGRYVVVHGDFNDGDISEELRGLLVWHRTGKVDWIGRSPALAAAYRQLLPNGSDHPGHALAVTDDRDVAAPRPPEPPARPARRRVRRARRRRARANRPRRRVVRRPTRPRRRPARRPRNRR